MQVSLYSRMITYTLIINIMHLCTYCWAWHLCYYVPQLRRFSYFWSLSVIRGKIAIMGADECEWELARRALTEPKILKRWFHFHLWRQQSSHCLPVLTLKLLKQVPKCMCTTEAKRELQWGRGPCGVRIPTNIHRSQRWEMDGRNPREGSHHGNWNTNAKTKISKIRLRKPIGNKMASQWGVQP